MKNIINIFKLTLLTLVISQLFISCKKEDDIYVISTTVPSDIISLNDSILYSSYYDNTVHTSLTYDLDLDEDGIIDLSFYQYSMVSGSSGEKDYTKLILSDNYEVLSKAYFIPSWIVEEALNWDTVYYNASMIMPINIYTGIEVSTLDSGFTNNSVFIANSNVRGDAEFPQNDKFFNHLIVEEDIAIVLKKTQNNEKYLGWIKIKVLDYSKIQLVNYRKMKKTNSLIII